MNTQLYKSSENFGWNPFHDTPVGKIQQKGHSVEYQIYPLVQWKVENYENNGEKWYARAADRKRFIIEEYPLDERDIEEFKSAIKEQSVADPQSNEINAGILTGSNFDPLPDKPIREIKLEENSTEHYVDPVESYAKNERAWSSQAPNQECLTIDLEMGKYASHSDNNPFSDTQIGKMQVKGNCIDYHIYPLVEWTVENYGKDEEKWYSRVAADQEWDRINTIKQYPLDEREIEEFKIAIKEQSVAFGTDQQ